MMAPMTELPSGLGEVDVIIAGGNVPLRNTSKCRIGAAPSILTSLLLIGGTAGLVVASRLSDAGPDLSILVIEGGKDNHNDPEVLHPVLFLSHLLPTSKRTLFYKGTKEARLGDREMVVPSGGVLGGGSSINLMTYNRAQRDDLDSWRTPGWSADEMIPYLKKVTYTTWPYRIETCIADLPSNYNSKPTAAPARQRPTATAGRLRSPEALTPEARGQRRTSSRRQPSWDGPRSRT